MRFEIRGRVVDEFGAGIGGVGCRGAATTQPCSAGLVFAFHPEREPRTVARTMGEVDAMIVSASY